MQGFGQWQIAGNITRDPELRHVGDRACVTTLGVAVNERVKKGDEWHDVTTFLDIEVWNKPAEWACRDLRKGSPIMAIGNFKLDSWEQDGQRRSKLKLIASKLITPGEKGERAAAGASRSNGDLDEIPF